MENPFAALITHYLQVGLSRYQIFTIKVKRIHNDNSIEGKKAISQIHV